MKKVQALNDESLKQFNTVSPFAESDAKQHWVIKYKVYHIFFWIVYHYLWAVINVGSPVQVLGYIFSSPKFIFYVIFQAAAVYFNLYYLIPRFLVSGKYAAYIFFLALTTVAAALIIVCGYYLTAHLKNTTLLALFGNDNFSHYFITYTLPSTVTSTFLAMSIKLTKSWIQSRHREQLLQKEKLETELKFLRSQHNPHFLFNTINSIFVLIHKNPDLASEALAKFSDLLRYQLYECNDVAIALNQELAYFENYIDLERLRQDSQTVQLTITRSEPPSYDYTIAPFLLIPFIENAFKHVSVQKGTLNWINIKLAFSDHNLELLVENSISTAQKVSKEIIRNSGIGLKNIQRRLNLLYPNKHTLQIRATEQTFEVRLTIGLYSEQQDPRQQIEATA